MIDGMCVHQSVKRRETLLKDAPNHRRSHYEAKQLPLLVFGKIKMNVLACQICRYFFVNMPYAPEIAFSSKCSKYRPAAGLRPDPLGKLTTLTQIPS